jgi:Mn-dependent DtxR family transcriptional regulator
MYLKSILLLEQDGRAVRVKDVADAMSVTMASVTEAVGTLKGKGLVLHDSYRDVRLTAKGRRTATEILHRFEVLRRFLREVLGVKEGQARIDACEIEHVASGETMQRLTAFLEYMGMCRHNVPAVIQHFQCYFDLWAAGRSCSECESDHAGSCAITSET